MIWYTIAIFHNKRRYAHAYCSIQAESKRQAKKQFRTKYPEWASRRIHVWESVA